MRALGAVVSTLASGCLAIIDTGPGDDIDDGPFALELPVPDGVLLVVYQDGDGPWQPLAVEADGIARTEIQGAHFGHGFVCPLRNLPPAFPPGHMVSLQLRTRRDPPRRREPCAPTVQLTADVMGGSTATRVHVGNGVIFANREPGPVPSGVWDVGVVDERVTFPDRALMLVARDVDLRADATLTVDLSRDGRDLVAPPAPPVIDRGGGVDDTTMISSRALFPSGTIAELASYDTPTAAPPPMLPPAGLLGVGDRVLVEVAGYDADGSSARGHQRPFSGQTLGSFQLPAHTTAGFLTDGISYSGEWDFAYLELSYTSAANPPTMFTTAVQQVSSAGWLAAAGREKTLPRLDPTTLPGWDASWAPPPTWIGWYLRVFDGHPDDEWVWAAAGGGTAP